MTAAKPSTTYQRNYVRSLLRQCELPTSGVTVMHRDVFRVVGIRWIDGMAMDAFLEQLSSLEIGRLINHLREKIGDDE